MMSSRKTKTEALKPDVLDALDRVKIRILEERLASDREKGKYPSYDRAIRYLLEKEGFL